MINSLPVFPEFRLVVLEDKDVFHSFTSKFPPYSDFNFTSLWSYNTKNDIKISNLNNNLVMIFRDYMTDEPFYTFIGDNNLEDTLDILFKDANSKNILNELRLLPEHNFLHSNINSVLFDVIEDPDNYDYILSIDEISELTGNKYHTQRNHVSRFVREHPHLNIRLLDVNDQSIKDSITELFYFWEKQKNKPRIDTITELTAIQRLLKDSDYFELVVIGIFDGNKLVGFTISDAVDTEYAMLSFAKGNQDYFGIYQVLFKQTAMEFKKRGLKYINIEQDLGIPGLKFSKQQWNPIKYLKKYLIKTK